MTPRTRVFLIVFFATVLAVVAAVLFALHQRAREREEHGKENEGVQVPTNPWKADRIHSPEIYLLLDVSGSLARRGTRPDLQGTDPENRQLQAVKALLTLGHHFSSSNEAGFAPRFSVLTFASRARWLSVNGQTRWELRSPGSLQTAVRELDGLMGGAGDQDRRRGYFTDWNAAFDAVARALETSQVPAKARVVLWMTDGLHNPFPGNPTNYTETRFEECAAFKDRLASEVTDRLEESRSYFSADVYERLRMHVLQTVEESGEPIEALEGLSRTDNDLGRALRKNPVVLDSFRTLYDFERQHVRVIEEMAKQQTVYEHLPRIKRALRGQADFRALLLSPRAREQLEGLPPDGDARQVLESVEQVLDALGAPREALHYCNDRGLANVFVDLLSRSLWLIRERGPLQASQLISVGGHVQGLAVVVNSSSTESDRVLASVKLLDTDAGGIATSLETESSRIFLMRRPGAGKYRLEAPTKGSIECAWFLQTNPLFGIAAESETVSVLTGPLMAQLSAFDVDTGSLEPLSDVFQSPRPTLVARLEEKGDATTRSGTVPVEWILRPDGTAYDLSASSFGADFLRQVGHYELVTHIEGLTYKDGQPVTPQVLHLPVVVEPALRVTPLDIDGQPVDQLVFPRQKVFLGTGAR